MLEDGSVCVLGGTGLQRERSHGRPQQGVPQVCTWQEVRGGGRESREGALKRLEQVGWEAGRDKKRY